MARQGVEQSGDQIGVSSMTLIEIVYLADQEQKAQHWQMVGVGNCQALYPVSLPDLKKGQTVLKITFSRDDLHVGVQITFTWPRWLARIVHRPRKHVAGLHKGNYIVADDFDDLLPDDFLITGS